MSDRELYQSFSRLYTMHVIDDMIFMDTEYGPDKACSLAQIPAKEIERAGRETNYFVLAGGSKIGLAGMRVGVAMGERSTITRMQQDQFYRNYHPGKITMEAARALFTDKGRIASGHVEHINALARDTGFLGRFAQALVDGVDTLGAIAQREYEDMLALLVLYKDINPDEARARLSRGIKGITCASRPEAGQFLLLDFNALHGYSYASPVSAQKAMQQDEPGDKASAHKTIECSDDLHRAMAQSGAFACRGEWIGLDGHDLLIRMSYAIPAPKIIEYLDRVEGMIQKTLSRPSENRPDPQGHSTLQL